MSLTLNESSSYSMSPLCLPPSLCPSGGGAGKIGPIDAALKLHPIWI
jgi:hypothetical protein